MKLKAGETVEVTERGASGGWSKGLTGAFPTDYVEFLPQTAQAMASTAPSTTTRTSVNVALFPRLKEKMTNSPG